MNFLEVLLKHLANEHACPYKLEYRFHPTRKWRMDVAFPSAMVAAEIDGGAWTQGRHTRGKGFIGDQEKINEAQLLGWRVYRFVPDDLENGKFVDVLDRALKVNREAREGRLGGAGPKVLRSKAKRVEEVAV